MESYDNRYEFMKRVAAKHGNNAIKYVNSLMACDPANREEHMKLYQKVREEIYILVGMIEAESLTVRNSAHITKERIKAELAKKIDEAVPTDEES